MITDAKWRNLLESLTAYLKFPSISALPDHHQDCEDCADYLVAQFKRLGFQVSEAVPTKGKPIVWAKYEKDPALPTVLIYGHYDVQPVDPLDQWETGPFEPVFKNGYVYCRGASDNKGQFWAYLAAMEVLIESDGSLPVNVTCIVEGEEEIGSTHLFDWVDANQARLRADYMWVSDNPMLGPDQPSICTSLRGMACSEVTIKVAESDLHSGLHGGAVPNALDVLTRMLVQLKDPHGVIQIPDFYEGVTGNAGSFDQTEEEAEHYRRTVGAYYLTGEYARTVNEQRWSRPTLEIHGICGGYQEAGIKTVVPCQASAKVSMRLVGGQHPKAIQARLAKYLEAITPDGAVLTIEHFQGALPITVDPDSHSVAVLKSALEEVTGKDVTLHGEGGSIPILSCFQSVLGLDPIMMGLGLADDGIHAPNERFLLANARMGVETVVTAFKSVLAAANTRS